MPNPAFLEPLFFDKEIGDYGTVTELNIIGTTPQVLCSEDATIRFGTVAVEDADIFVLIDNNTNVWANPTNYNFQMMNGDTWTKFRFGKQRHTVCTGEGLNAVVRVAIASQEIIII